MKNIKVIKNILKKSEINFDFEKNHEDFQKNHEEWKKKWFEQTGLDWDKDVDDEGNLRGDPEFNMGSDFEEQEETFPVTMISEETAKLAEQEVDGKITDEHEGNYGYGGMYEFDNGASEYYIFDNWDDAESCAVKQVYEQLSDEPELFTQSWLQNHVDEEKLERDVLMDMEEEDENYYNENYPNNIIGYLTDMYGDLESSGINLNNYIDINSASQDAVDTDGVAHFLAGYDGDEIELSNGGYMYRYN